MSELDALRAEGATWSMIDSDVVADAILAAGWVKADAELSDSDRDKLEHWSRDRLDG